MIKLKSHRIVGLNEECASVENEYYLKSEADKVIADLEESHKKEVSQLLMEIEKLKEQQRWHKFPAEWPPKEMIGEEFIVSNGNYSKIAEWDEGYWENDPFCGSKVCDEVIKWKYLD